MPISEAALDAPRDLVATRYLELTDTLRGVRYERGIAQGPMARREAERLRMVMGSDFEIVGPWPPAPAQHLPIETPPPPAPAVVASEPEDSPSHARAAAAFGQAADMIGDAMRAPTRRLKRAP